MKTLRLFLAASVLAALPASATNPPNPVLYVTQMPIPDEALNHDIAQTKMNVTTTMQSPLADPLHAGRGGSLWIRYTNGTRRNLLAAASLGGPVDGNGNATGFQGAGHEVQNHVGRHEFGGTSPARGSFTDDATNLVTLTFNHPVALNFLHLTEAPASPGTFYAVTPPEFGTPSAPTRSTAKTRMRPYCLGAASCPSRCTIPWAKCPPCPAHRPAR